MIGIGISIPMMMPFAEDATAFVRPGVLRAPFTITRAQLAGVQSSAINGTNNGLTLYGADVPRFTGSAQRLLIEEQGTNGFSNPWLQGAVAGNPGTPPTNTNTSFFQGLSREIVGTGTEGEIPYIDLRFFGTATGGTFSRFGLTNITTQGLNISGNAVSTFSTFVRLVNGSLSQISDVRIGIQGRDVAGANVSGQSALANFTPTAASLGSQRRSVTFTPSDVTVIYGEWFLDIVRGGTATVDVTLRIGLPQHELGAFASSPILPPVGTLGASTRGADFVSAPLSSLGIATNGACTVLFRGLCPVNFSLLTEGQIACISNGGLSNFARLVITGASGSGQLVLARRTAGVDAITVLSGGGRPTGTLFNCGVAFHGTGRVTGVWNGSSVGELLGAPTTGFTTMDLFHLRGILPLVCEPQKVVVLPQALSDANLQAAVSGLT